ncbi:MAG: ThiF family adenylyltransferase [Bacteroidales bacterium]|nr:ThiF family adenylyltransferase [Bacteroidales bacterium]
MEKWQERTEMLLGAEGVARLAGAKVVVVGVGGVGAAAAEMLARAGVGHLVLIDSDTFSETNINRQLPALHSTVGKSKVETVRARLLDINPSLDVKAIAAFLDERSIASTLDGIALSPEQPVSTLGHVRGRDPLDTSSEGTQETVGGMERSGRLPGERCYFVVDAIDTLSPKIALIQYCLKNGIKLVSSMGSGAKLDATKVRIADISKTKMCPLAHMLRKRLHHLGITTGFLAVYSEEAPRKESTVIEESRNKKSQVGTISYLPTVFGCVCAQAVISRIVGIEGNC